ncbi:hypothetical protein VPHD528_0108 [Vibrio phage D528]
MAGCIPKTKLLLTRDGTVIGEFNNYREMGAWFQVTIDETGRIMKGGIYQNPTYTMAPERNGYQPEEAIADWCKNYLAKNVEPRGYKIYRYLENMK